MAKQQRCLMCGDAMYEMTNFGEPVDGQCPQRYEDPHHGTILVCPHCEAEHLTAVDPTEGRQVLRVRGLKRA